MSEKTTIYCSNCDKIYACPVTNSEGNWYWSEEQKIHYRKRIRRCTNCSSYFATYEISEAEFERLVKQDSRREKNKQVISETIAEIALQLDGLKKRLGLSGPLLSQNEVLESEGFKSATGVDLSEKTYRVANPGPSIFPTREELKAMLTRL